MKFEKRKTTKLLEFLRPDYITVGRENSKVSSGRHTLDCACLSIHCSKQYRLDMDSQFVLFELTPNF